MRILEIEKYFQDEANLDKVLEQVVEDFNKVDDWAKKMKEDVTDIPEEAKRALNELTGTYANLKTVLALAESEKENREVRKFESLRIDSENTEKKFTAASTEKTASAFVAPYRRIRNIIEGYTEACEKQISTLQSILKYMGEELKLSKD